jgi:hypothetical protein
MATGPHGIFRGTAEDTLAAAQGAEMFKASGKRFDHHASLKSNHTALVNWKSDIDFHMKQIHAHDLSAWIRTGEILAPALGYCFDICKTLKLTDEMAERLKKSHGDRLKAIAFGAGGTRFDYGRGEVGRSAGLISKQIPQMREQFRDLGIAPQIFPFSDGDTRALEVLIARLPLNGGEVSGKIEQHIAAIRRSVQQTLFRARLSHEGLTTILGSLDHSLAPQTYRR